MTEPSDWTTPTDDYNMQSVDYELFIDDDGESAELIGLGAHEWIFTDTLVDNVP